jgi:hypothetical protein
MLTQHPIINGMARALFVIEWSNREEEEGRTYSGQALEDVAPETPREAFDAAHNLCGRFENANDTNIHALLWKAAAADGLPHEYPGDKYADGFGWDLALEALGHGVSWFDDHGRFDLHLPSFEFNWEPEVLPC